MNFDFEPRTVELLQRLRSFLRERIAPFEAGYQRENRAANPDGDWTRWRVPSGLDELKAEARAAGLWNLFLADPAHGAGLSTLDYAPLAEEMGRSLIAPEIFNCNAPDSGNAEILLRHGGAELRERWLAPLLGGEIRSVFCMSEPEVASSDPTNLRATIREEGDELVLDGRKWWATGLGHPRAAFTLFLGCSDPEAAPHERHSLVLVPLDAPGVRIVRMLPLYGDFDPPHGHGEVELDAVRVPRANLLGGRGKGFAVAQERLGPGRIHHCMRAIGAAEWALESMIARGRERTAFGRPLLELGGNLERVADLRVAIDQARLLTLHAAWTIDRAGPAAARARIAAIKLVVPSVLERVVDESIQLHGAAGLAQDLPLAALAGLARALRIADGPDAVHRQQVARAELAKSRRDVAIRAD